MKEPRSDIPEPSSSERPAAPATETREDVPVGSPEEVTRRSLAAYAGIESPRLRFLVQGMIEHLHRMAKALKLTDPEWEFAWDYMERMAAVTGPERNEFLLFADVIGVSQLIEAIAHEGTPAGAGFALVGPFYRAGAPLRGRGASIASEDTPGDRVRVTGRVFDAKTNAPIAKALVSVWQTAPNGLYENQDPKQPDFNLRGRFETDPKGTFELVAILPTPYPVPTDGPVGELLRVGGRQAYRPAHIHFIVSAPGYETFVTQIFREGDERIPIDPVFTASRGNVGRFEAVNGTFRLSHAFPLEHGESRIPRAPIPDRRPPKAEAARRFFGTWRLVDELAPGNGRTRSVFGANPTGYIHYDESGLMSVQLGKRARTPGLKDVATLETEYHAYFGRYEVDAAKDLVRHFIEGQIVPGQYPSVVERRYRFSGDLLVLQPVEGPPREVIWRRVG